MDSRNKSSLMQQNGSRPLLSRSSLLVTAAICMAGYVFFSYAYSHDQNGMLKSAEDPSKTCFSTEDFKIMFTARVANPDPQLTSYLELHKVHRHYPDFQELLETLYHTKKSIYDAAHQIIIHNWGPPCAYTTIHRGCDLPGQCS